MTVKENTNNVRSVLAKLLAKEDITVQHGNYSTAFFDVKSRTLGLPIWKDKGKDVYDLLVGHEVGHALYSPMFDPEKLPAPHSYVNVVEDIRIERMIQATYPGLVRCFSSGYATLHADDFFGVRGQDVNKLSLPDRINLHAKLGALSNVRFAADEAAIVKQCFDVQTWEDTLEAAAALHRFCKEQAQKQQQQSQQQKQQKQQSQKQKQQKQQSDPTQQPDRDPSEEKQKSEKQKSENQSQDSDESKSDEKDDGEQSESRSSKTDADEGEDSSKGMSSGSDDSDEQTDGDPTEAGNDPTNGPADPTELRTADNFDKQARSLIDNSNATQRTGFLREPTYKDIEKCIVGYKEVFANRDTTVSYRDAINYGREDLSKQYTEFMAATHKYVNVLKKEFDMRKAAYQYSRATVARTGVLNVNKLHSYKIDDDIFLSRSEEHTSELQSH